MVAIYFAVSWFCASTSIVYAQDAFPSADIAADDSLEATHYRFRIAWGGGTATRWSGQLAVTGGEVTKLKLQGSEFDTPAAAHLEAGVVRIHHPRPFRQAALDVTVAGSDDAVLRLTLNEPNARAPEVFVIPLQELLQSAYRRNLGDNGATLSVRRAEADKLRIATARSQLIFKPGEPFTFDITAALPELSPAAPIDLSVELLPARGGRPIWSAEPQRLSTPLTGFANTAVTTPLPKEEGVYTLRIAAIRPPGSVKAWLPGSSGDVLAEREFQVVVFDQRRQPTAPKSWRVAQEIDPTTKRWWDRLPKWVWLRRAPWIPEGPLGYSRTEIVPHAGGRLIRLPVAGDGPTPWQAYPIPVPRPGQPYLIEVDYPADTPQQLVVSIIDRDRLGAAGPVGASAGVTVSSWDNSDESLRTVRRLFWPKSESPLLVLSSGDPDRPVRYGRIRLMTVDQRQIAQHSSSRDESGQHARWQLAHILQPDLPAAFGATYGGEPEHEDWQTFYETCNHLGDWLKLTGQDGAVLTVASAAGTIYPSQTLADLHGVDRERHVAGVDDLPHKDALELLLQDFDRRELRLVPAVNFEALLPELLKTPPRGKRPSGSRDRDSAVRDAVTRVVAELYDRYGHHPSFGGVAIRLTDRGYLQTVASESPEGLSSLLTRLAEVIDADGVDRRMLVLPHEALMSPSVAQELLPQIDAEPQPFDLQSIGLDIERLQAVRGISVVMPRYHIDQQRLADEALRLSLNEALPFDGAKARHLFAAAKRQRLADFETASPFGAEQTSASLRIVPVADADVEAYSTLLADGTPDVVLEGGDVPSLTLDSRLATARRVLRESPPGDLPARTTTQQPLVVQAIDDSKGCTLQIANTSPWAVEASITVRTQRACTLIDALEKGNPSPLRYGAGEHALRVSLSPFQVQLMRFDQQGVEPLGVRCRAPQNAIADLESRLADLRTRNLNAESKFTEGPSPSFEALGPGGAVADWGALTAEGTGTVALTKENVADGEQAVRLLGAGGTIGVQSRVFAAPETGQLAMVFRVRPQRIAPESQLRVTFDQPTGPYRSFTLMDATQLADSQGDWRPYVFSVNDLPLTGSTDLRIKFELIGAGQVDIDHLEMYDLVFPLDFLGSESKKQRLALLKTIHAAESALADGRISDCKRQLESYWPRFLQAYTPVVEPTPPESLSVAQGNTVDQSPSAEDHQQEESEAEPPGLSERFREYLPSFMRF